MSIIKKVIALAAVAAMALTMVACKDTSYAAKSGDITVPAGVYIYYQVMNYYEAVQKVEDKDNFSKGFIDGKKVDDWIKDQATEDVKTFVTIEKKYDALGLELSEKDKNIIKVTMSKSWPEQQATMEKNGIGEVSMKAILTNEMKKDQIFTKLYGENSEYGMTTEKLKEYYNNNYARVMFIPMELKNAKGEAMTDAEKTELLKKADDFAKKLNDGYSFYKLFWRYSNDINKAKAEAKGEPFQEAPLEDNIQDKEFEQIVKKDSTYPSEAFVKGVFNVPVNEAKVIKDDNMYYVVKRLDNNDNPEIFENLKDGIIYDAFGEEFENQLKVDSMQTVLVKNEDAYKRYDPMKLKFN